MAESPINEFYSDKVIFLTGATGFVGKVLLEKILYSLPNVKAVYILVREKRGKSAYDRVAHLARSPVFTCSNRVPLNTIKCKVHPIVGDISKPHFGLSEQDYQRLIEEVNVVFNCAASVKFVEPLKDALGHNVQSALNLIELSRKALMLESVVHVSTCYAHGSLAFVDEQNYPSKVTAETMMQLAEVIPDEELDKFAIEKLFKDGQFPYNFTKSLAEDYVYRKGEGLPISIARLSIVYSAVREPVPGFIDVALAASFVVLTQGLGVMRNLRFTPDVKMDGYSVDAAASALIATGWATSLEFQADRYRPVKYYNLTYQNISSGQYFQLIKKDLAEVPFTKAVRPPAFFNGSPSKLRYFWDTWVSEYLFAVIVDKMAKLYGKDLKLIPKVVEMQKVRTVIESFASRQLNFGQKNFHSLMASMSNKDRDTFNLDVSKDMDVPTFLHKSLLFFRENFLKDPPETIKEARRNLKLLHMREALIQSFLVLIIGFFLYIVFNVSRATLSIAY